ncbi:MAG: PIN domain-containing protein [Candidatus Heimdallarchaeota archaeon]
MQTILLDSSFLFPYIQIDVKSVNNEDLLELIESRENNIIISDISLFELSAKGNKYIQKSNINPNDLTDGLNTIINENQLTRIPIHYSEIQILAFKIGKLHKDFIDCLILATAFYNSDVFLTLDDELFTLVQKFGKELDIDKLQIIHWNDFIKNRTFNHH